MNEEKMEALEASPKSQEVPKKDALWLKFVKNYPLFAKASGVYAVFYAFCLFRNAAGITYPFFAAGTLFYFYYCAKKSGVTWKKGSGFYSISILLLGLSVCLTSDFWLRFLTKTGMFLLLVIFVLGTVFDDRQWETGKYLSNIMTYLGGGMRCLFAPFENAAAYRKLRKESLGRKAPAGQEDGGGAAMEKNSNARLIGKGLLIAVCLLAVILPLLASADAVFAHALSGFSWVEDSERWVENGMKVMKAFVGFLLSFCLTAALFRADVRKACMTIKPAKRREPVTGITMVAVIDAVYVFFCGIQIIYLFANKGTLPEGYTYASYAREGFFSLLAVCILNLVLVVLCIRCFGEHEILKDLLALLSGCTYVMLASSAYRMYLYVQCYGLTWLRVMVWWALLVLAVWMAFVVISIFRRDFPLFKAGLVAGTVFYLCIAFARPDFLVAKYEMGRARQALLTGEEYYVDGWYLLYEAGYDGAEVLLQPENYALLQLPGNGCFSAEELERYRKRMMDRADALTLRTWNAAVSRAGKAAEKLSSRP